MHEGGEVRGTSPDPAGGFSALHKKSMITREKLAREYLEWRNNYLSPALFAEHRGLTEEEGETLIELGRKAWEETHPDIGESLEDLERIRKEDEA